MVEEKIEEEGGMRCPKCNSLLPMFMDECNCGYKDGNKQNL